MKTHLRQYVEGDNSQWNVAVVNRTQPEPILRMVEKLFDNQPVSVSEGQREKYPDDTVLLLKDGDVVEHSKLRDLSDSILMVNSDLYTTGSVGLEDFKIPDVIKRMQDTTFQLRGFPESNSEKLVLTVVSRYIEYLTWEYGGSHRASFQRLSRIDDESGTENVYRRISNTGDVHVYGVPDTIPEREMGVKIHAGWWGDYKTSWFVTHESPMDAAALVAIEDGPNEWLGRWTTDRSRVEDINETVKENL